MKKSGFWISRVLIVAALSGFMGCGNKDSDQSGNQPQGTTLDSLSPDQRAEYCYLNITHENSAVAQQIENSLNGSWQHYPLPGTTDAQDHHRTFNFEFLDGHNSVTLSDYDGIITNIENFKYDKVCVSTPLDQSAGIYAGYRVLELTSADNQGVAAVAFKIDTTPGQSDKLLVSDRYYDEYPNFDEAMPGFSDLLNTGNFTKTWIYSERDQ